MAFNDLEKERLERACDNFLQIRRPPPHLRAQVDVTCKIEGQSIVIYQVRPKWNDPSNTLHAEVAKATFVREANLLAPSEWAVASIRAGSDRKDNRRVLRRGAP